MVVLFVELGFSDVVQMVAGHRSERRPTVDHQDLQIRVGITESAGHRGSHQTAADDDHVG